MFTPLEPPPSRDALPAQMPTPFDRRAVHPLARRAAAVLMAELGSAEAAPWRLDAPGNGKMFGVLVATAADGTVGFLRAFSGMLAGRWDVDGWAPPTFDRAARDVVWTPGEAEMRVYAAQRAELVARTAHDEDGVDRARATAALHALDATRTARSRDLMRAIQDCYAFADARGTMQPLRALFAPGEPPAGAGDCAGPKLLAQAYRMGLTPVALAEFWWGAPPPTGDRRAGVFYAACRGKCLPILTHMLGGLPHEPPPLFGAAAIDPAEPRTLFEDEHLLVVHKPAGLLTVPGRSAQLQDCVVSRLRARYPEAEGQLVAHRLDMDTSGLLVAAKRPAVHAALQRLFSLRQVTKHYVALLDGIVPGTAGDIHLPLRPDLDDRPRNIHDPVHGKPAHTAWQVLSREGARTRVQFTPHTGRSHQLRVHAAHPAGLDAPIVGDRLYGRTLDDDGDDTRLHLHAAHIAFVHPVTDVPVSVTSPVPF